MCTRVAAEEARGCSCRGFLRSKSRGRWTNDRRGCTRQRWKGVAATEETGEIDERVVKLALETVNYRRSSYRRAFRPLPGFVCTGEDQLESTGLVQPDEQVDRYGLPEEPRKERTNQITRHEDLFDGCVSCGNSRREIKQIVRNSRAVCGELFNGAPNDSLLFRNCIGGNYEEMQAIFCENVPSVDSFGYDLSWDICAN